MIKVGIICEFNPIHAGHIYLFDKVREKYGKDCALICIMSGNFTQRGLPAIYPKYKRAEAALLCGANAVFELPFPWCSAPAPFFAKAGVTVAKALGCDVLAFGSESGDIGELKTARANLDSEGFKAFLESKNTENKRTSVSHTRTLISAYREFYEADLLTGANNTLALEYLSAASDMEVFTVKRDGIATASGARNDIIYERESHSVPEKAKAVFEELKPTDYKAFDLVSFAFMREHAPRELARFADGAGGLAGALFRQAGKCKIPDDFFASAADKKHTASRVRRFILACMCQVTPQMWESSPTFTCLLAADAKGRAAMQDHSLGFGIVTKPASYKALPMEAARIFEKGTCADSLFGISAGESADDALRKTPFIRLDNAE